VEGDGIYYAAQRKIVRYAPGYYGLGEIHMNEKERNVEVSGRECARRLEDACCSGTLFDVLVVALDILP
jgi:hypothetical protein